MEEMVDLPSGAGTELAREHCSVEESSAASSLTPVCSHRHDEEMPLKDAVSLARVR